MIRSSLSLIASRTERAIIHNFWREAPGTVQCITSGNEALAILEECLRRIDLVQTSDPIKCIRNLSFSVSIETIAMQIARTMGDRHRHNFYRYSSSQHIVDIEALMGSNEALTLRRSIDNIVEARNIEAKAGL